MAVVCAQAALQQPPADDRPVVAPPGQLAAEANSHYGGGRWALAAERYEALLAAQPNLAQAHFYLGHSYLQLHNADPRGEESGGYLEKAITHLRLAADRDPLPSIRKLSLEYLLTAYGPLGRDDAGAAVGTGQRLLAMSPGDSVAHLALAKLYEDANRLDEAEASLLAAVGLVPGSPTVRRQLAGFYMRRGEFDRAMAALDAAVKLEPQNPALHQLMASYYVDKLYRNERLAPARRRKYLEQGIAAADRALALKPDYPAARASRDLLFRKRSLSDP